jgi:hypothetical protein
VRNSQRDAADAARDFSSVIDANVAANSAASGYLHQPGLAAPLLVRGSEERRGTATLGGR